MIQDKTLTTPEKKFTSRLANYVHTNASVI